MIFKRAIAKLRAQDWAAITIELLIVIVGVFIGTWVANRNQEGVERRAAEKMVGELRPGLKSVIDSFDGTSEYLAIARAYSDTAFAGWASHPNVSDEQFVIAAYQASQVNGVAINAINWTQIYGGNQLQLLDDPDLRQALSVLMTLDYTQIDQAKIETPYREHVRQVIPQDIQDAIRAKCGDTYLPERPLVPLLPATCTLNFPRATWAQAARILRAEPQLVNELRWHRAAVATFIDTMDVFEDQAKMVLKRIDNAQR